MRERRKRPKQMEKLLDKVSIGVRYFLYVCLIGVGSLCLRLVNFQSKNQKIAETHPCANIESVRSDGYTIQVKFKQSVLPYNPLSIASYFGFWTSALDLPLLMPPGSASRATMANLTLSFDFPLPIIENYTGELFCVNKNLYKSPPFQLPEHSDVGVVEKFSVSINNSFFRDDITSTQILCHGDGPGNRWCEARNIGIASGHLVMETKAHIVFPATFISLGSRAQPFDDPQERICSEPLLTNENIHELAVGVAAHDEIAFLCDTGKDRDTSEGIIFEFLLPVIQTFRKMLDKNEHKRPRFFVRQDGKRTMMDLITSVTVDSPVHYPDTSSLVLLEQAVIGLDKVDENCDITRSMWDMFGHVYRFEQEDGAVLRETVMRHLKIQDVNHNQKIITFIDTGDANNLEIRNLEPIRQFVVRNCKNCKVQVISRSDQNITATVETISQSDVLIGRTGVGLEHAVWLKPGSVVVELRPIKFWCDDRYAQIAKASGSKYFSVMNSGTLESTKLLPKVEECRSTPEYCESPGCYSILRNHPVDVELSEFKKVWQDVMTCL